MPGMPTTPSQRGEAPGSDRLGHVLPAAATPDAGEADTKSDGKRGIVRRDTADADRAHDLADADRRHVRLALVEPAAHRRIERHVVRLDERLARRRRRHGRRDEVEVLARHHPRRARAQIPLTVLDAHRKKSGIRSAPCVEA
jgi:hypothetical protein